jgi:hypothetical protein
VCILYDFLVFSLHLTLAVRFQDVVSAVWVDISFSTPVMVLL